jgi:hypothetical protein
VQCHVVPVPIVGQAVHRAGAVGATHAQLAHAVKRPKRSTLVPSASGDDPGAEQATGDDWNSSGWDASSDMQASLAEPTPGEAGLPRPGAGDSDSEPGTLIGKPVFGLAGLPPSPTSVMMALFIFGVANLSQGLTDKLFNIINSPLFDAADCPRSFHQLGTILDKGVLAHPPIFSTHPKFILHEVVEPISGMFFLS